MPSERQRLLELALESLHAKREQIDEEIAAINKELRTRGGRGGAGKSQIGRGETGKGRKSRFSKEERLRRSKRMKAYWEKWRKEQGKKK
jgi:hypothetical protein